MWVMRGFEFRRPPPSLSLSLSLSLSWSLESVGVISLICARSREICLLYHFSLLIGSD